MAQLDLRAIVEKNDDIMAILDEMERLTADLERKAGGYALVQTDEIMRSTMELMAEIRSIIKDTKAKTEAFSQAKKDGALYLNEKENLISSRINKI